MAVNKNFVVKNGLEVDTNLLVANAATNKVGIATTNPRVELDVRGGIAATDISISGVGTIVTLQSITGTVTNLSGTNLNYSGIATANSISIGATQVISNARQLQNIVSLDATTTATIESAIANAPNTFSDLKVTGFSTFNAVSAGDITLAGITTGLNVPGISTLGFVQNTNLSVTGFSTFNAVSARDITLAGITTGLNVSGVGTISNLNVTNLNVSGLSTFVGVSTFRTGLYAAGIITGTSFVPTSGYIKAPDGTNSFFIYSTTGNVSFQGTIGASQLNSASGNKVVGLAGSDGAFTRNVTIAGIATVGGVAIGAGIVTASPTSGIVTYYGDGSKLTGIATGLTASIGIQSGGVAIGSGVTTINVVGTGFTAETTGTTANLYLPPAGVSLGLAIALGG